MTDQPNPPLIFDRALLRKRRARAAARTQGQSAFLHQRAMGDIVDRLESTIRGFDRAIFYGAGPSLIKMVTPACGVGEIFCSDLAIEQFTGTKNGFAGDEETWPIAPQSVDLIVSLLTLHNANDLIGALTQMRMALKPDGLFIAALFGEDTLLALRDALYRAETSLTGGVSPRVAPFASVRDLGAALHRAGFAMPVADLDRVCITYENPMRLFSDLRMMGETSALVNQGSAMTRTLIEQTAASLKDKNDAVRFDIVYLTGWAPHSDHPKPLSPGSAKYSMAQAVENS